MDKLPKYIIEKCKRLDKLCNNAHTLRCEIENWAEKQGIDIYGSSVLDEIRQCDIVCSISEDGLLNVINEIKEVCLCKQ